jgi:glycosyltransferase involved in cell wall biosynthesis
MVKQKMKSDDAIKIAYFIDVDFNDGGAPISTDVLISGIAEDPNYSVCLYKPVSKNYTNHNYDVIELKGFYDSFPYMLTHPFKWFSLCKRISQVLSQNSYDIVHAQMPFSGMAIGLLRILKKIDKKTKIIYTDREHVATLSRFHKIRYRKLIAKTFDCVVAISDESKNYWQKNSKRVARIYNTSSLTFESLSDASQINNNEKLNIMFAGRMVKEKNWSLAVSIVKQFPNANYLFVISAKNDQRSSLTIFDEIAKLDNVTIETNLPLDDMKQRYRSSDIFILTSIHEAFGRTAVEAMSQSTCVIGSNVDGIPEVIGLKENVCNLNANEYVQRLTFYDANRSALASDKLFFYERYKNYFSLENNISSHKKLYKQIIEK